jgi:hypothetical protein
LTRSRQFAAAKSVEFGRRRVLHCAALARFPIGRKRPIDENSRSVEKMRFPIGRKRPIDENSRSAEKMRFPIGRKRPIDENSRSVEKLRFPIGRKRPIDENSRSVEKMRFPIGRKRPIDENSRSVEKLRFPIGRKRLISNPADHGASTPTQRPHPEALLRNAKSLEGCSGGVAARPSRRALRALLRARGPILPTRPLPRRSAGNPMIDKNSGNFLVLRRPR